MDVMTSVLQFAGCAAVIVVAGTVLTKCADTIAELTKLGRLLVGSVLLAGATSLPELTVDIAAIRLGAADLAIGDLLGSSLANVFILAVLDLSHHSSGHMLSRRAARHALSGSMSIALTALVGLSLLTGPMIGNVTFLGIGPGLWLVAAAYLGGLRIVYHDQRVAALEAEVKAAVEAVVSPETSPEPPKSLLKAVVGFVAAAAAILVVGPFMARAAEHFAQATGMGRTFVGTTLVALSTSLPEFVSSLAAIRMKAFDLAIGNVFGSNSFNMLLMMPLDIAHPGALMAVVAAGHGITCFAVILATQTAIMGQLYNVEGRWRFIDLDAWLVIAIVVGGLALVYYTQ
jgi:cation:H+ antiporter